MTYRPCGHLTGRNSSHGLFLENQLVLRIRGAGTFAYIGVILALECIKSPYMDDLVLSTNLKP